MITGEYRPGDILLFAGSREGLRPSIVLPETTDKQDDGFDMATAFPVDWEGDGDLDLVVGSVKGRVFLNRNDGTPAKYEFGDRVPLLAGGKPMKVVQKSDPIAVDWDGDGARDLLVGDEAGGVTFFKGAKDFTFAAGVSVFTGEPIPPGMSFTELRDWWQPQSRLTGFRYRLAVADWDGDGKLDLLIGDCEDGDGDLTGHVWLLLRR